MANTPSLIKMYTLLSSSTKFPVGILIAIICLILLSAFFSATETAFTSSNRIRLKSLATNGSKKAKGVLKLTETFDKLISAILIGNNIVNLSMASLSTIFFMKTLGEDTNYALISTIVITVVVLVFGEITPKFIAKNNPEKMAMLTYPFITFFMYVLFPITFIFGLYRKAVAKIFKIKNIDIITEEEIITYVEEAEEDGTFKEEETKLIRSAIEFDDLEVGDILIPRINITAIDEASSMDDVKALFESEGFSRVPVYKDTIDTVVGIIHEKDFFTSYLAGKKSVKSILQPVTYTTQNVKISILLKQLQLKKMHMAIVLDEYGGTLGLVTLEDILEELVGEIWDEHDEEVNYFKKVTEDTFLVDGKVSLTAMIDYFELKNDEDFSAYTVSGFVIEKLGEIPKVGAKFEFKGLSIEVVKATIKKVIEIKVVKLPKTDEEDNQ